MKRIWGLIAVLLVGCSGKVPVSEVQEAEAIQVYDSEQGLPVCIAVGGGGVGSVARPAFLQVWKPVGGKCLKEKSK